MARLALVAGLVGAMSLIVADEGCSSTSTGAAAADGSAEAATVVADAQSDAPIACANGYDCSPLFFAESSNQSSVPCCSDKVCRLEPYDDCTDANAQLIQAANYDQACTVDKDCVAVSEGNFCYPGTGNCPNAAISQSAYAQYQADVAKTRAASCYAPGSCGDEPGPCCVAGKCQAGLQCPLPAICCSDAGECGACPGDAGADAATDGVTDAGAE